MNKQIKTREGGTERDHGLQHERWLKGLVLSARQVCVSSVRLTTRWCVLANCCSYLLFLFSGKFIPCPVSRVLAHKNDSGHFSRTCRGNRSWVMTSSARFHLLFQIDLFPQQMQILIWFKFFSVPNLYPQAQPTVYPPPPNSHGQDQYQNYFGEGNPSYGWPEHPPPTAHSRGPFQHGYQEDPDCITFLRGWYVSLLALYTRWDWCVHSIHWTCQI